jgi:multidrug efflux pump subunit AcrB
MIQAGRRRLRPIAMTALATIAGMLPLAVASLLGKLPLSIGGGSGSEMLQPLAIAVIGGLLSSIVLSLVLTPTMHYYLDRGRREAEAQA